MSIALCRQFVRPDGTLSEKVVSLTQFRELEAGWIRVTKHLLEALTDQQIKHVASTITDVGDQQLFREALVEHVRAGEAA